MISLRLFVEKDLNSLKNVKLFFLIFYMFFNFTKCKTNPGYMSQQVDRSGSHLLIDKSLGHVETLKPQDCRNMTYQIVGFGA